MSTEAGSEGGKGSGNDGKGGSGETSGQTGSSGSGDRSGDEGGSAGGSTRAGSKEALLADLARERDARQAAEARAKKYEDEKMTEQQRLERDATSAKDRADTAEGMLLKYRAAAAAGLDLDFAERLKGSTEKELADDAKALAASLGGGGKRGSFGNGAREGGGAEPQTIDGFIRGAARRGTATVGSSEE